MKIKNILSAVCLLLFATCVWAQKSISSESVAIENKDDISTFWKKSKNGKKLSLLNGEYHIQYVDFYISGNFKKGLPLGALHYYTTENGTLIAAYKFDARGLKHGQQCLFYAGGGRKSAFTSVHGKMEGTYEEWYENGNRKLTAEMKGGEYDGLATAWNEQGEILSEWRYADGLRNGKCLTWIYGNDVTHLNEEYYKDGQPTDTTRFYRLESDGGRTLQSLTIRGEDNALLKFESFDGDTHSCMEYKEDNRRLWTQYVRGQLSAKAAYEGDVLDGECVMYYPGTSRIWKTAKYDKGKLIYQEEYSPDGTRITTGIPEQKQ